MSPGCPESLSCVTIRNDAIKLVNNLSTFPLAFVADSFGYVTSAKRKRLTGNACKRRRIKLLLVLNIITVVRVLCEINASLRILFLEFCLVCVNRLHDG